MNMNINLNIKRTTALTSAFIFATTAMATTQVHAKTVSPSTAKYNFTVKDKVNGKGKATRTLKKSGSTWTYSTSAYALGGSAKANQTTTFTINGNKVKPSKASTSYKVLGVGNTHKVKFNSRSAVSTYKGKSKTLSMPNQAYDDLSLEIQIRQDLLNGKFTGNYHMVKKDKIVRTRFKKSGSTSITVPAGTYKTVRVDRVHSGSGRQTTFWLAPSLDYLPVKVYSKNGSNSRKLELTSVN